MAFRVKITGDLDYPIVYNDGEVPINVKARGFRINGCNCTTQFTLRNRDSGEAVNGFWVDASSAITDSDGIVHFS
jgi:hypothetical protein